MDDLDVSIAARYAEFAAREALGVSPAYERLSLSVSRDADVLALLATLPGPPARLDPGTPAGDRLVRYQDAGQCAAVDGGGEGPRGRAVRPERALDQGGLSYLAARLHPVQLRYSFRLYPDTAQRDSLAKTFGCARVVFNDGLRARQTARENGEKYLSDGDLSKQVITQAKLTPERAWLGEVSAVVLQQALADLNVAYRNFFASVTGKRKGRHVAPPRFRSRKDNRQAIRFTANARFKVLDNGRLRLPKIGDLDVRWSRDLPSAPSSVTIVKDAAGRYFASFVVQTTDEPLPGVESEVGIDLGLSHFAVLSDGTKVAAPKFLRRAARKLRKLQKDVSRKQRGSQNRKKAVVKVARAHARVADTRRDWQHKLSTRIIRDNQAVYVENLCVVGIGRTRLAESVHDAGWASFTAMLEYKAARWGRTFGRVDRFFPSTRMCSDCGRINEKMALNVRAWDCPCGAAHDRDVNAAINVLAAGRAESLNDRGARVRPALVPAARREAVIHPGAACSTRSVEGIPVL